MFAIINAKRKVRSDHAVISELARMNSTENGQTIEINEEGGDAILTEVGRLFVVKPFGVSKVVCCIGEDDDIFQ